MCWLSHVLVNRYCTQVIKQYQQIQSHVHTSSRSTNLSQLARQKIISGIYFPITCEVVHICACLRRTRAFVFIINMNEWTNERMYAWQPTRGRLYIICNSQPRWSPTSHLHLDEMNNLTCVCDERLDAKRYRCKRVNFSRLRSTLLLRRADN